MKTIITACFTATVIFLASCQKSAVNPVSEKHMPAFTAKSLSAASTSNDQQDFDMTTLGIQVSGCTGEQLKVVSGIYHLDIHSVLNNNNLSVTEHVNAQNFKLVGAVTGTAYTGSVSYEQTFNTSLTDGKLVNKETQSILVSTPGGKNNVLIKIDVHVTLNNQGTLTVYIDNFRTDDCK
jgi:hypothetical protein